MENHDHKQDQESTTTPLTSDSAKECNEIPKYNDLEKKSDERYERGRNYQTLRSARGLRYQECLFSNFVCQTESQTGAVKTLSSFVDDLRSPVAAGRNVILFGPKGTGKDHLLMALMSGAVMDAGLGIWKGGHYSDYHSYSSRTRKTPDFIANRQMLHWVNGIDIPPKFRDGMTKEKTTDEILKEFIRPDVLCISDPLPPIGALTEFQMQMFFNIIDSRYNEMKPIWVTVNAANRQDLEERLGAQSADRLLHDALIVPCNWGSYRQNRGEK